MARILQVGLGPVGCRTVRLASERGFEIVGAVDPAPDKCGKDLAQLCGGTMPGIKVAPSVHEALAGTDWADVAIVTTVSRLRRLEPLIVELAEQGLHIVSTSEELAFPWHTQPETAKRIDNVCREHGVSCLGTGVNPGFLMDYLPCVLTGISANVERVQVWRIQDASIRRVPFQQKIGAGLTVEAFRAKEGQGTLRHVGLPESLDMIASCLGWTLDDKQETLDPVIAEHEVLQGYTPIAPGCVRGVEQTARGFVDGAEVITLTFKAAIGEPEVVDRIRIEGDPTIESSIEGGVNGDIATCAITVNAVRAVLHASPGLKTMCDIAPVAWSSRSHK